MKTIGRLRVALGEYDVGWHDPDTSLDRAAEVVERSAAAGARLVVLPEMCTSGFTMDVANHAEPMTSDRITRLAHMARAADVWLIAGVPTLHPGTNDARNSALILSPSGELVATYHKQKLFAHADEQRSYQPGNAPVVVGMEGLRVAPFICYDLRFPELFRSVAEDIDVIVVIASWPAARRSHWDALLPARAIENQCYVVGVNRTGIGGGIAYDGGSVIFDPWGAGVRTEAVAGTDHVAAAVVSAAEVSRVRDAYPFLADADRS